MRGSKRIEEAVKYHFNANPCGGHIQMCLRAEWVQDHNEEIIDEMTVGTRLREGSEEKEKRRNSGVYYRWVSKARCLTFSPSLPISRLSFQPCFILG